MQDIQYKILTLLILVTSSLLVVVLGLRKILIILITFVNIKNDEISCRFVCNASALFKVKYRITISVNVVLCHISY